MERNTVRMMRNKIPSSVKHLVAICAIGLAVSACQRTEPIYNVENRPAAVPTSTSPSFEIIGDAIVRAAAATGWTLEAIGPDRYRGTIGWHTHTAVVNITYTDQSYSIVLDQSQNLLEGDGQIHRNYNRRVAQLEAEIDRQLSPATTS
jgi:hypothetical protein